MSLVETHSNILDGEPHIKGHRISVRQIIQMVHGEYSPNDVMEQLQLEEEEVEAALRYYRFNKSEIEDHIREEQELLEETRRGSNAPTA